MNMGFDLLGRRLCGGIVAYIAEIMHLKARLNNDSVGIECAFRVD